MEYKYLVKNVRCRFDLNQREFASVMGVDRSLISKWESGDETPTESRIFELMYFYELYTKDGEATRVLFAPYIKEIVRRRK